MERSFDCINSCRYTCFVIFLGCSCVNLLSNYLQYLLVWANFSICSLQRGGPHIWNLAAFSVWLGTSTPLETWYSQAVEIWCSEAVQIWLQFSDMGMIFYRATDRKHMMENPSKYSSEIAWLPCNPGFSQSFQRKENLYALFYMQTKPSCLHLGLQKVIL